jgi:hypothetical protein
MGAEVPFPLAVTPIDAKIYSVGSVCFHISKTNPPQLVIHATGSVNSSGWKNGRLIPWSNQPKDGVLDLDFVATVPTGFVMWVICPIEGSGTVRLDDWIKGVRVHASGNATQIMLDDTSCSADAEVLDLLPWPWRKGVNEKTFFQTSQLMEGKSNCTGWTAWHNIMVGSIPTLHVKASCVFPSAGYSVELRPVYPQGINPSIYLLEKVVHEPSAPAADVITTVELHYTETTKRRYKQVHIQPDNVTINVLTVS